MTKKLAIIFSLIALVLLGIVGIKFPNLVQQQDGVLGTAEAAGGTYYVSPSGSDTTGDGSQNNPWQTIGYAIKQVPTSEGGTILVADGVYNEWVWLEKQYNQTLTIQAINPYKARWTYAGPVLQISYSNNITVKGFEFTHTGPGGFALVVQVGWSENIVFENNIFHDSYDNDILKIQSSSATLRGNVFYNQIGTDQHIDINYSHDVEVTDNIFFNDFAGSGRSVTNDIMFIVVKNSWPNVHDGDNPYPNGAERINFRRNVFLNFEGEDQAAFLQYGDDPGEWMEASNSIIENNLFLDTNNHLYTAPIRAQGRVKNLTIRNNTINGNYQIGQSAFGAHSLGLYSSGDVIYNNIFSDPTGTMQRWGNTATTNSVLNNNLYWNNGNPVPDGVGYFGSGEPTLKPSEDVNGVFADPKLPSISVVILPHYNPDTGVFLSGNITISQEFERLVNTYGVIPSDSAAIDKANSAYAPTDDILGNPRANNGTGPDLGAYELPDPQGPDTTPPSAITNLSAQTGANAGEVNLNWTAPGDDGSSIGRASFYIIKYATSEITEANWDSATTYQNPPSPKTAESNESFTVANLTPTQTYYFAIKTQDEVPNISGISNSPSAMAQEDDQTPPNPPQNLIVTQTTSYSITLSWQVPNPASDSDTASSYKIYRGALPGVLKTTGAPVGQTNQTSFTDTAVSSDTTYYYIATAIDDAGNEGQESNEVSATTLADTAPPANPSGLVGTPGNGKASLTWNANSEADLSGYKIYRSQIQGGPYTQRASTNKDTISYEDTGLTNLIPYYYVITAYDANGNESGYSNEASVIPAPITKVITFQQGDGKAYSDTADAGTSGLANGGGAGNENNNYGAIATILIYESPTWSLQRFLIQFPNIFGTAQDQIPLGSTITSAVLTLKIGPNATGNAVDAHKILKDWGEGIGTGQPATTGESSGKYAKYNTDTWNNCQPNDIDAESNVLDSIIVSNINTFYNWTITSAVQSWSDGNPNYGILFRKKEASNISFRTSEYSIQTDRPKLTVTYVPPQPKIPNITLTKSALVNGQPASEAAPGDIITYTIAYKNIGAGEATNIVITDPIPAGTIYETDSARFASGPTGIIDDKTPTISWTIATLPAGQGGEAEFRVRVE